MLHHTLGLAISHIKYRETSIIAKVYTQKFGIQSYLINGVRSPKAKMGLGLFSPLTQLQMVVYYKQQPNALQRISEVHIDYPYQKIGIDFGYTAIAIFITEVLEKCINNEEADEELFAFIQQSFQVLDVLDEASQLFSIRFLFHLSQYLGFGIQNAEQLFQALADGKSLLSHPVGAEEYALFESVSSTPIDQYVSVPLVWRRIMLNHLLDFYSMHIQNFTTVKSLKVLQESMS